MQKHHPKNERIKRAYVIWLQEAKRLSPHSIDQITAAIALFELSTKHKDFAAFHIGQAKKFKSDQLEATNAKTGKPMAKATIKSRFDALKGFFLWLADQSGYKSKITHTDCDYFNISANDARIATAKRERPAPDLDQVHFVLGGMKHETAIEKRDRAIIAFALLTGARDDAIASLSLRQIDLAARKVFQDARFVRTKNRKTFETDFFQVGGQAEQIVIEWIAYLKDVHRFGPDDPLFPQTLLGLDENGCFAAMGLKREHWKNADAIRKVFKRAFTEAGLPPFNPHSIRKTLVRFGEEICRSPEEFKSWSQNLGHEQVLTTFNSYGNVSAHRQSEIIRGLSKSTNATGSQISAAEIAALEALLHNARSQRPSP